MGGVETLKMRNTFFGWKSMGGVKILKMRNKFWVEKLRCSDNSKMRNTLVCTVVVQKHGWRENSQNERVVVESFFFVVVMKCPFKWCKWAVVRLLNKGGENS